jgi:hypothetical protein
MRTNHDELFAGQRALCQRGVTRRNVLDVGLQIARDTNRAGPVVGIHVNVRSLATGDDGKTAIAAALRGDERARRESRRRDGGKDDEQRQTESGGGAK